LYIALQSSKLLNGFVLQQSLKATAHSRKHGGWQLDESFTSEPNEAAVKEVRN
jgi:hypothetical protein